MYKQMAQIHACTPTGARIHTHTRMHLNVQCAQIHIHADLLKLSSEHGVTH